MTNFAGPIIDVRFVEWDGKRIMQYKRTTYESWQTARTEQVSADEIPEIISVIGEPK